MPLNKYGCEIAHICPNVSLLWYTYGPLITTNSCHKRTTATFTYDAFAMYVSAINMPIKYISHICKLLDMYQWGKWATIEYCTQTSVTTTKMKMQPNGISQVANWQNQQKKLHYRLRQDKQIKFITKKKCKTDQNVAKKKLHWSRNTAAKRRILEIFSLQNILRCVK